MKRTGTQKGITLVSLVITIVILLILGFAVIAAVKNEDIIKYADEISLKHSESVKNESNTINGLKDLFTGGNTINDVPDITIGDVDIAPGTTIKGYDATKDEKGNSTGVTQNVEWKLLGKNSNGQILLVSATNIKNNVIMDSYEDYENGGEKLHTICSAYGNGKYAQSARSIKLEDITVLTGDESRPIKYSFSMDNPEETVAPKAVAPKISTSSRIYKVLFENASYWLPNSFSYTSSGDSYSCGLYTIENGKYSFTIFADDGDGSPSGWEEDGHGVRAVVTLKENVIIDSNGNLSYNK